MEDKIVIMEGEVHRTEKRYDNDIEYVRKGAILNWIKECKGRIESQLKERYNSELGTKSIMFDVFADKINSM